MLFPPEPKAADPKAAEPVHAANAGTEMIASTTITEICGARNSALHQIREAAELLARGFAKSEAAVETGKLAHNNSQFSMHDHGANPIIGVLRGDIDVEKAVEAFRKWLDAKVWMNLIQVTNMHAMMDKEAKDKLYADLCADVPEVNEENIRATLRGLITDRKLIFQRGLANAFSKLDRRFRSHDAFKIGSRVILTYVFNDWGSFNYSSRMVDVIDDLERVMCVLAGEPVVQELRGKILDSRPFSGARQSVLELDKVKIRCFKNGNAHLYIRDDLVLKANLQLAEYYGEVLPDATERGEVIRSSSTTLAKNLSFYETPKAVVNRMVKDVCLNDAKVLEPSAGTGSIVEVLLKGWNCTVHAVEVDPTRTAMMRGRVASFRDRVHVQQANFLELHQNPIYTHVVMNPPFYGVHWMDHVMHAMGFLQPGGTLVTVLPSSFEFGDSKRHDLFRAWALEHSKWNRYDMEDLPAESFAASGTRISTCVLTLYKPR